MGHARPFGEPTFYLDGTGVARMHAASQQFLSAFLLDLIQKKVGYP
jgi:hypothetical protein